MTCAIVGCDNAEFGEHDSICEDCLSVYVRLRDAGTVDNWREFNCWKWCDIRHWVQDKNIAWSAFIDLYFELGD
jgi:hypothetical protein